MGKRLKIKLDLKIYKKKKLIFIFSDSKFYSVLVSPTIKFYSILVSPTTKFYCIWMSRTTKFYSIWMSPTTTLDSTWGVRQSSSQEKGFTPQTGEHWGSLHKMRSTTLLYIVHCTVYSVHCILYTVHCTLYTVWCTLYTVHTHLSVTVAWQSPNDLSCSFPRQLFTEAAQPILPDRCGPRSRAVAGDTKTE